MPFVARIILVGRDYVKPVFHFVINQLKRCGIFVVARSGLPLICAAHGGSLAVCREQITADIGCWRVQKWIANDLLRVFCEHKKTGAGPVFVFLFAVGSEEGSLERVAGIEPA